MKKKKTGIHRYLLCTFFNFLIRNTEDKLLFIFQLYKTQKCSFQSNQQSDLFSLISLRNFKFRLVFDHRNINYVI